MEKKAQNITISTIVIIVLALVVLVVLIIGFVGGWGNMWERVTGVFGTENVDSIVQSCGVACSLEGSYDYCERLRTLKFEDAEGKLRKVKLSCYKLSKGGAVKDDKEDNVQLPSVDLSCNADCEETCDELGGQWGSNECTDAQIDKTNDASDKGGNEGKKCCVLAS